VLSSPSRRRPRPLPGLERRHQETSLDNYRSINALAESFVDTFKTELISDRVWRTRSQMEIAIVEYVGWFNQARLHESLGDRSPEEFESLAATQYGPHRNTNNTDPDR
jgi:transposase InsO family protein